MGKGRKRIAEILIEEGLLTEEQFQAAVATQESSDKRIGEILVEQGAVSERDLSDALAKQFKIERVYLDHVSIPVELLAVISRELLERHNVFPVAVDGNRLKLAMADPLDVIVQDDVHAATGYEVVPLVAAPGEIRRALGRTFKAEDDAMALIDEADESHDDDDEDEYITDSPNIRIVNLIVSEGIRQNASDIHVQPEERRVRIRYRIDGRLRDAMEFRRRSAQDIVSRLKIMANLDITVHRRPQDGRIQVEVDGQVVDLRVSTLPTIYGEKVVLRVLSRSQSVIELNRIPFTRESMTAIKSMLAQPQGLILVCGPTGSGKTTTLYSFLQWLNQPDVNIITVEDPVELRVSGLSQVAVNPRGGITFAGALRSILRQDPDIVMIGEMRDEETAEIAVRAALTGHLVLSTVHTNNAAAAVGRLLDMGIQPFMLAGTLTGIVAQRLVRRLCRECRQPVDEPDVLTERFLGERLSAVTLYRPVGCGNCGQTGYSGRVVIEEALLMTRALRKLIRPGVQDEEIHDAAVANGMVALKEAGIRLILDGVTTAQEVVRSIYSIDDAVHQGGTSGQSAALADLGDVG